MKLHKWKSVSKARPLCFTLSGCF